MLKVVLDTNVLVSLILDSGVWLCVRFGGMAETNGFLIIARRLIQSRTVARNGPSGDSLKGSGRAERA